VRSPFLLRCRGMDSRAAVGPRHWLAFSALGIVWGTTWVAADTLAEYVPPLRGAAIRFLLAALLCMPVILWKRPKLPRGRALGFLFILSVSLIVLPSVLLLWAQPWLPSATVAVLFAGMPLLVVFLTPGLAGRDVPRIAMQASIVGLGGDRPGGRRFLFRASGWGSRDRAARGGIHRRFFDCCSPRTQ